MRSLLLTTTLGLLLGIGALTACQQDDPAWDHRGSTNQGCVESGWEAPEGLAAVGESCTLGEECTPVCCDCSGTPNGPSHFYAFCDEGVCAGPELCGVAAGLFSCSNPAARTAQQSD